jgi:hypothetical protein
MDVQIKEMGKNTGERKEKIKGNRWENEGEENDLILRRGRER